MSEKKVALISLYSSATKGIPPLAPLYLATALKKNNIQSKIIYREGEEVEAIVKEVEAYQPDLVGLSVFTGYYNKKNIELSRILKDKGYKIAWGNAHPSLMPKQTLREECIDFVVFGEGEETLVDLVSKLDSPEKYHLIPGLCFKDKDSKIIINKKREFVEIDDYLIDWSLINVEDYLAPYFSNRYQRVLAVVTSRGCPFNCQFCYNLVFNNRKWRGHSPEKMIANLKPIIDKYKIDAIRFLDDNFFVNQKRAFKIAEGLGLPYFADGRVDYVDEEFAKNLKATKCLEIMFGFESGSDRILKQVVQKGIDIQNIIKAVTLLKDSGTMASGSFVFGMPTETKEEYKMTMNFIMKLLEINPNLAFTCGWFLPYPGTGLYEKAKEMGFKPPEKVADWDQFDRWRNDYRMSWLDWDYEIYVKYTRQIIHLLALAHKRNIPILKSLLKWRVKNLNFSFPLDMYLFSKLRSIYLFEGDKNLFNKVVKGIIVKIIKFKQS